MYKTNKANLGDIIMSEKFAFGYYDSQKNPKGYWVPKKDVITVDGKTREYPVRFTKPGTEWDQKYEKETVEHGAYDESRKLAQFVVESAQMELGGTGHGLGDTFPDGWYVQARRLNEDGSYNSNGELIKFYQSGCSTCLIPEVELVGRMKRIFVRAE